MMLDLIAYRLYRLRRLIVVALLPTLATLFWASGDLAHGELVAVTCVALLPLLHVLAYPGAWMETISVSVGCVSIIVMGPHLDATLDPVSRGLWFALLLCMGMLVFCAVLWTVGNTVFLGPRRRVTLATSGISKLDPATVKAGLTLHPGRRDDRATCGPADEAGLFRATLHIQKLSGAPEIAEFEDTPDAAYSFTDTGELETDMFLTCKVESSTETEHHVIFHLGEDETPGLVVHRFEAVPEGTRVEVLERSMEMPVFLSLGMWLEDYFADHLVSEIERIEGAKPLSNRNRTLRQFVVDLAMLMKPFSGPDHPHN